MVPISTHMVRTQGIDGNKDHTMGGWRRLLVRAPAGRHSCQKTGKQQRKQKPGGRSGYRITTLGISLTMTVAAI